jgi:hypothetical protein
MIPCQLSCSMHVPYQCGCYGVLRTYMLHPTIGQLRRTWQPSLLFLFFFSPRVHEPHLADYGYSSRRVCIYLDMIWQGMKKTGQQRNTGHENLIYQDSTWYAARMEMKQGEGAEGEGGGGTAKVWLASSRAAELQSSRAGACGAWLLRCDGAPAAWRLGRLKYDGA